MFYKPKNAIHTRINRRKFLELGGLVQRCWERVRLLSA